MAGLPSCKVPGDTCKGQALQKKTPMAAEEQVFQDAGAAAGDLRTEVAQPSTDEFIKKYRIPKRRASKLVKKAQLVQNMWNNPIVYKKPPSESRNMVNYEENFFEEMQVPPEVKAKPLAKKNDKPKFYPVPIHDKLSHYDYKPLHVGQHGNSSQVLDDVAVGCLESDFEKSAHMAEGPVLSSLGKSMGCPDAYFQYLCPLYGRKEASNMVLELYPDPTSSHHGSVVHGEDYYYDGSADNTEFGWEDDNYVYTGKYL